MAQEEEENSVVGVGAVGANDYSAYESTPTGSYQIASAPFSAAIAPKVAVSSSVPGPVAQAAATSTNPAEIQDVINRVNNNLAGTSRVLDFGVDPVTGMSIATIRNSQTGVVLQQIPGTDMVNLARMLEGWSAGKNILLDLLA
jgi:uncharacterized FlaG/YvyC family protein